MGSSSERMMRKNMEETEHKRQHWQMNWFIGHLWYENSEEIYSQGFVVSVDLWNICSNIEHFAFHISSKIVNEIRYGYLVNHSKHVSNDAWIESKYENCDHSWICINRIVDFHLNHCSITPDRIAQYVAIDSIEASRVHIIPFCLPRR